MQICKHAQNLCLYVAMSFRRAQTWGRVGLACPAMASQEDLKAFLASFGQQSLLPGLLEKDVDDVSTLEKDVEIRSEETNLRGEEIQLRNIKVSFVRISPCPCTSKLCLEVCPEVCPGALFGMKADVCPDKSLWTNFLSAKTLSGIVR